MCQVRAEQPLRIQPPMTSSRPHMALSDGTIMSKPTDPAAETAVSEDLGRMRAFSRSLPMALLKAREEVMAGFRPNLRAHAITEQQWRAL